MPGQEQEQPDLLQSETGLSKMQKGGSEESWERKSHLSDTYQTTDISSPPPSPSLKEKKAVLQK